MMRMMGLVTVREGIGDRHILITVKAWGLLLCSCGSSGRIPPIGVSTYRPHQLASAQGTIRCVEPGRGISASGTSHGPKGQESIKGPTQIAKIWNRVFIKSGEASIEGRCDRSLARSAWDSATSKEPSRRVRCDLSKCAHRFDDGSGEISNLSRRVCLPKETRRIFRREISGISCRPIIPCPTGRFLRGTLSQALRARLRSVCPYGTVCA
jgi:hypothetical protein